MEYTLEGENIEDVECLFKILICHRGVFISILFQSGWFSRMTNAQGNQEIAMK